MSVKSDVGRFAIVPEWLLDSGVSAQAIRLFAILAAKYADRATDEAHPSRRTMGRDLGASPATVDRVLRELVDAGALEMERRTAPTAGKIPSLLTLHFGRPGSSLVRVGGSPVISGDTSTVISGLIASDECSINPESIPIISDPEIAPAARGVLVETIGEVMYRKVWPGSKLRPIVIEELIRMGEEHGPQCVTWAFNEVGLTERPTMHRIRGLLNACATIGHGPRANWYEGDNERGSNNGRRRQHDGPKVVSQIDRPGSKFKRADGWAS